MMRRYLTVNTFAIFLASMLFSQNAFASSGGDLSQEAFETLLILIGVIGLAYVVARVLSGWVERKWGIVTGAEYIVLGIALGPGLSVLSREIVIQISPAIVLAEGSLGLYAGLMAWNWKKRQGALSIGAIISISTLLAVTGVPSLLIYYFKGTDFLIKYIPHLLFLGAIAMIADASPIRSLVQFLRAKGEGVSLIQSIATVSTSAAIVVFGLVFCLFKPVDTLIPMVNLGTFQSALFWLGVHVTIGMLLGLIFALFLRRDLSEEKLLTVGIGIVIFTSGIAYFLKLSPIFVSFILGLCVALISKQSENIEKMLMTIERPAYISLYFFLGATLSFQFNWLALLVPIAYIILRHFGRWTGSILARQIPSAEPFPLMGRALWGPGSLSAAMALNYYSVFREAPLSAELYLVSVLVILLSEPIAYRVARVWLIDATDVDLDRENQALFSREVIR